nr:TetR/AcrR family transcriptional regulator [Vibrio cyclitrophicus]
MDKKQQAIQAAIELFATQGFEKTSIVQVCETAKVSKGLVFHHFKNKDDLLRKVFVRMAEIISEVGENSDLSSEGISGKREVN